MSTAGHSGGESEPSYSSPPRTRMHRRGTDTYEFPWKQIHTRMRSPRSPATPAPTSSPYASRQATRRSPPLIKLADRVEHARPNPRGLPMVVAGISGEVRRALALAQVRVHPTPDEAGAELVSSKVVHCHQLYPHYCSISRGMPILFANGVKPHSCDSERNDFYSAAAE